MTEQPLPPADGTKTENDTIVMDMAADIPVCEVGEVETQKALAAESRDFRLPNAKQNQPFEQQLSALSGFPICETLTLVDDGGTGLSLLGTVLSGSPRVAGDVVIRLRGEDAQNTFTLSLALLINPDPRTLWNDIEPESPLFRKPHRAYHRIAGERATLTAARVRGRAHAHKGSFCEDDFAIVHSDAIGYVGMVSDGAGSSRFSRLASQLLTENVPRQLQKKVAMWADKGKWRDLLDTLADNTLDNAPSEAQAQALTELQNRLGDAVNAGFDAIRALLNLGDSFKINDLYATCLIFWALPLPNQRWALLSFWVGDGGLAVLHGDDADALNVTLLGTPDSGEFSGQTRFLTEAELADGTRELRLMAGIYHDLHSVWAMTDGITDAKFPSEKALATPALWQTLVADLQTAIACEADAYDWLNFWSQGNHDDRAFAGLTCPPPLT